MGGIANTTAFKDLFGVTFASVDSSTIVDVIDVGRSIFQNLDTVYSDCLKFADQIDDSIKAKIPAVSKAAGICSSTIPEKTIRQLGLSPAEMEKLSELRRNALSLESEDLFLSGEIAAFVRANYSTDKSRPSIGQKPLSFSKLWIVSSDFSNVDFTEIDLNDAILDDIRLDGAKLTPKKFGGSLDIRSSAWWDASAVHQVALDDLTQYVYPYYVESQTFSNGRTVDRDYYASRLAVLCVPMRPNCSKENLKFGQSASAAPGTGK
jgi:hypothetical protein